MKKSLTIVALAALSYFFGGCTYWYQPETSFTQCQRDFQQCYTELKKYADMRDIGNYEVDFIKECMQQKGYTLTLEDDLPMKVKRVDPDMDTFWLLAGMAGTIEQ